MLVTYAVNGYQMNIGPQSIARLVIIRVWLYNRMILYAFAFMCGCGRLKPSAALKNRYIPRRYPIACPRAQDVAGVAPC